MKEKRYGGGVRKCEKCGDLINGSKLHRCKKDEFASIRNKITESTKQSGYTVYIPEEAKISKTETWQDILDEFAKFGKGKLGDWLINNFKTPERL